MNIRDGSCYQIGWFFGKVPRGGVGAFSIQEFMLQILGTLNRAFWAWNWYQKVISGFRVCFFNNQNETHFEECSSSHNSLRDGSGYQNGWISGKVPNGSWLWTPPVHMIVGWQLAMAKTASNKLRICLRIMHVRRMRKVSTFMAMTTKIVAKKAT